MYSLSNLRRNRHVFARENEHFRKTLKSIFHLHRLSSYLFLCRGYTPYFKINSLKSESRKEIPNAPL